MDMSKITQELEAVGVDVHPGYPDTGARLPYLVSRPLSILSDLEALCGQASTWDLQYSVYCCAASVEASYNLAVATMQNLHGKRVDGTTLSTSMGYVGARVEGHYETQVTIQIRQGALV